MTLGKQTNQHIAAGVRASIQDDFSRPIAEAVKGPIAELRRETYHAKNVMADVAREARFHTWSWFSVVFGLGLLVGALGYHFMAMRTIDSLHGQLDTIQQQMAPAAPASDAKTTDGKATKGHRGGH